MPKKATVPAVHINKTTGGPRQIRFIANSSPMVSERPTIHRKTVEYKIGRPISYRFVVSQCFSVRSP